MKPENIKEQELNDEQLDEVSGGLETADAGLLPPLRKLLDGGEA